MQGATESPDAWRHRLQALAPDLQVECVASTGSTNSDLLERVRADEVAAAAPAATGGGAQVRRSVESRAFGAGAAPWDAASRPWQPILRVAEEQTAGRGRHGRPWQSRRGASLTFSLAWLLDRRDASGLSLAVGVALAEALEPCATGAAPRIGLKWPNDLWLRDAPGAGRKLGGILIETVPRGSQRVAVIGVGLNLQAALLPAELSSGFASLDEIEPGACAPAVLERIVPALLGALARFETQGLHDFAAAFARRDLLAGHPVETLAPAPLQGTASGIDAQGALLVRSADGRLHSVSSGEVSVRLQTPAVRPPV